MAQKEKISIHQFTVLVILITIGDAILVLPSTVTKEANQDAWLATLLALGFSLVFIYLFIVVSRLYQKLSFVQYSMKILGKWFGSIVSIFFLSYLFFSVTAHVRELGDFVTTQILIQTPIEVIVLLFVFIIVMGVRSGLEPIARTSELLFPIVCFFLILLLTLLIPNIHVDWVQPILENGIKPVLKGTLSATAFPFMELVVFLMILPSVNKKAEVKKSFFVGSIIGGIILIIVVLLCILVLGKEATIRNVYPTFILARVIHFENMIQRIEGILATIWIVTAYLKITIYSYALHLGFVHLLKLDGYRILTLPFGMILFASTILVTPNISFFNQIISLYWPFYDATVAVILPLILVIVFAIRKRLNTS